MLVAVLAVLAVPAAALAAQEPTEREARRAAERAVPLPTAPEGLPAPDSAGAAESSTVSRGGDDKPFVPGEVIVRFADDAGPSDRAATLDAARADVAESLPIPGARLLEIPAGADPREAAADLERQEGVLYAQPNFLRQPQVLPNDPRLNQLWGLHNTGQAVNGEPGGTADADIDAPEAWNLSKGSAGIKVAVVDSGVAYDHPALAGNMWTNNDPVNGVDDDGNGFRDDQRGWDFVDDDRDPMDEDSHGTHVAGTIGARGNDAHSIVGVNWQVGIMPLRVLGPEGGSDADIASAFVYAAREGARVVNASLGGPGQAPLIEDAVDANPRVLYVVAAGNGGSDGVGDNNDAADFTPCNIPAANLICVAATNQNDQLTDFSNYGQSNVDLAAPGFNILSAIPAFRRPHFTDFQDNSYSNFEPNGWTISQGSTWGGYDDWTADFGAGWSVTDSPGLCWPGISTDGCYKPNFDHAAYSPQFSLAGMHHCTLSYWLYVDISPTNLTQVPNGDFLQVGAFAPTKSATAIHNWNGGPGSPQQNPWTDDLSAFEGRSGVQIYLSMNSDGTVETRDGAHVDDVAVNCLSSNYGATDFDYFPGTSMASPHVAGAAALILARTPRLSVPQLRQVLLSTVDKKSNLSGVTGSGGRLNANKGVRVADARTKLRISDVSITEGHSGTKNAVFTVRRQWAAGAVSVKYATANGTAKAPSDYKARSGTLGFTATQRAKKISVPVVGDRLREKHEKFSVRLTSPSGTRIGDGVGIGTIRNDD